MSGTQEATLAGGGDTSSGGLSVGGQGQRGSQRGFADGRDVSPERKREIDDMKRRLNEMWETLSPSERRYFEATNNPTFNSPSAVQGPPKRPCRRSDLSEGYLPGRGESSAARLNEELKTIIQEHDEARADGQCEHNSYAAAPFLSVLQSTGYGKTRAVLELAKTKKLVYLLLKDLPGSWVVPSVVRNVLKEMEVRDEQLQERKWCKFLSAVKSCVGENEKYDTPKKLYDAQITSEGGLGGFYEDLETVWKEKTTPAKSPMRSCLKNNESSGPSTQQDEQLCGQSSDSKSHATKKVRFSYSDSSPVNSDSLVVCFDEVSTLQDGALRALGRAAKHSGILAIFSDTAASTCKVMKPKDHSSQEKGGTLGRFVSPIFSLNTTDLTWKHDAAYSDYENLFCAGRPQWRSHINLRKAALETIDQSIESLIVLATNLLVQKAGDHLEKDDQNLLKTNEDSQRLINLGMIALFACRFSLGPRSKLSPMLVKHSLATVIGVSEDRTVVCSSYPSEPVLAEASARHTKNKPDLRNVLKEVKMAFHNQNKMLDPPRGDVGEMCAAALLGYAMDSIRIDKKHKYMSETVELKALLSLFHYGQGFVTDVTIDGIVKDWNVNFTHFVRPPWMPTQNDLKVMWNRRMAYYVPDGARGLDLLIALSDKNGVYGTLRVQVKNYSNMICKSDCKKYLEKLLPSKCPPVVDNERFSVGLVLSVNSIHECHQLLSGPNHTPYDTEQGTQSPLENPVLQLATCFPRQQESPLAELSKELTEICSQNTSQKIDMNPFCEEEIRRAIQEGQSS